ncbi:class I SAM-dependent methyltransferase [Photobacterium atrarenae]|uniref:Class I SAM-dependent methyltransferase n=1 Tax=Photobacterium atrarenae TaxID=865757 RepID=A0ABY5GKG0_9GAMM|nr:methyltransferase domain-containing protein [Photobacterium atrarenae]UTV28813.1 class I SAM-dependent methyltransferase [Photobacterium atrarenae]
MTITLGAGLCRWGSALALLTLTGCSSAMFTKIDYSHLFDRKSWSHTDRVIEDLQIKEGDRVADLGAGDGYFSYFFSEVVGEKGQVLAVDIDEEALVNITDTAKEKGFHNISTIQAAQDDPLLNRSDIDLVFLSNTYHHIENRVGYFNNIKKYLNDGARVAVLDTREGTPWFIIPHGIHAEQIRSEMKEAGYIHIESHDYLPFNNFEIFLLSKS